jgi:hypothetical protein
MKKDTTTTWNTKGGNFFQTFKKCKTTFILNEFFENKSIDGTYMLILPLDLIITT